jgi:hypothetical protein
LTGRQIQSKLDILVNESMELLPQTISGYPDQAATVQCQPPAQGLAVAGAQEPAQPQAEPVQG